MRAAFGRVSGIDLAAALYAAVYFAWLAAHQAGVAPPQIGDVAFYPLGLVVAWANWRNSRVEGLDGRTRAAWRLLALSALILWGTGSAWTLSISGSKAYPLPGWIDDLAYLQYGVTIAGYLAFPGGRLSTTDRTRFRFDVALVVVAGFVIAYYFSLRLVFLDHAESRVVAIADASLDWALFAVAGIGYLHKRDGEVRRAMLWLLASNLAYLGANSILWVVPDYRAGHPIDALWFSAWALRFAAARQAWFRYAARVPARSDAEREWKYHGGWLPYVMVGGALLLLLYRVMAGDDWSTGPVAIAAMIMGTTLVVRQFTEIEENRRLFSNQIALESRFRSLVQNSSDVLVAIGRRGQVTYVSPSVCRVFGPDARIETDTPFEQLLPAEDAAVAAAIVAGGTQRAGHVETRLRVAPDRWREVEMTWSDLREDPIVGGIIVSCRDIADRREYEGYLRRAQELDAVGHMAGGFAHDLNNLLMVIRGYAELLRSECPEGSPLTADLDQILVTVDRAASMTGKILAFSRKQVARRRPLDLNAVVGDTTLLLGHVSRQPVEIRTDLEPALWLVNADQLQMEQVLVNLVSNAADAMPQGGAIRIETANAAFDAQSPAPGGLPPGRYVRISVADPGIGMTPEIQARAFEPFFSTKPAGQGLGLGLAAVRSIVADMDGHIAVESREGRGSTFTVLLPRVEAE